MDSDFLFSWVNKSKIDSGFLFNFENKKELRDFREFLEIIGCNTSKENLVYNKEKGVYTIKKLSNDFKVNFDDKKYYQYTIFHKDFIIACTNIRKNNSITTLFFKKHIHNKDKFYFTLRLLKERKKLKLSNSKTIVKINCIS
jgi:hypothetical protein